MKRTFALRAVAQLAWELGPAGLIGFSKRAQQCSYSGVAFGGN